jgi:hypothetical protein
MSHDNDLEEPLLRKLEGALTAVRTRMRDLVRWLILTGLCFKPTDRRIIAGDTKTALAGCRKTPIIDQNHGIMNFA